MRSSERRR